MGSPDVILHVGTCVDTQTDELRVRGIRLKDEARVLLPAAPRITKLRCLIMETPYDNAFDADAFIAEMRDNHQADVRVRSSLVRVTPCVNDATGGSWREARCAFMYFKGTERADLLQRYATNKYGCTELRREVHDDAARKTYMRRAQLLPYNAWPCGVTAKQESRCESVPATEIIRVLRAWILRPTFGHDGTISEARATCIRSGRERTCVRADGVSDRDFQAQLVDALQRYETVDCLLCDATDDDRVRRHGCATSYLSACVRATGRVYLRCQDASAIDMTELCQEMYARGLSGYEFGPRDELLYRSKTRLFIHNASLGLAAHVAGEEWVVLPPLARRKREEGSRGGRGIGGCQLRPTLGVHHARVTVYDFASFYPSCIAKFNLGPDTVVAQEVCPASRRAWLPVYHIGGEHDAQCDCCAAVTFTARSRTVGVLRDGHRNVRVWVNAQRDEGNAVTIMHAALRCSPMAIAASGLLRERLSCQERGDTEGAAACKLLCNACFGMLNQRGPNNFLRSAAAYRAVVLQGRAYLLTALCIFYRRDMITVYGVTDSLFVRGDHDAPGKVAEEITQELDAMHAQPKLTHPARPSQTVVLRCVDIFSRLVIYAMNSYAGVYHKTVHTECLVEREHILGCKLSGFRYRNVEYAWQRAGFVLHCAAHVHAEQDVLSIVHGYLQRFRGMSAKQMIAYCGTIAEADQASKRAAVNCVIAAEMRARVVRAHGNGSLTWDGTTEREVARLVDAFFTYARFA
ncbi:hypothetical protein CYMTET_40330 [Cymbomonas tetramitiformis]|uniref:DNA-directed DNA polymerase n=1 Tax=Cymbomonas tetramitiformis TaxID=36881 RepID=A0AAE0CA30_9CHLO|nr:hypothetical protein CYMTET_40330 [Cymbomonas tetramitiformis]